MPSPPSLQLSPLASLWGSDMSLAENTVGWWGNHEVTLSSGWGVLASLVRLHLDSLPWHLGQVTSLSEPYSPPMEGADWTSLSPWSLLGLHCL